MNPKHDDTGGERVTELLGRMTLEEKVAQLYAFRDTEVIWDEDERFHPEGARKGMPHGTGFLPLKRPSHVGAKAYARDYNDQQRYLVEETRLGVPGLSLGEGLHGYMARGATIFPSVIGLASTWDPELLERIYTLVAREMRARGCLQSLSPVLDLAREPRWGRFEECFGEDPYLVGEMGKAAVFGLQGRGAGIDEEHVVATGKHFAGHGQPEGGRNTAPANLSERALRENHLRPFEVAVKEAGLRCLMASYNEVNAVPSHANRWLLTEVLRGEWGFDGYVIADANGIPDLHDLHRVAVDSRDAARQALEAGVDAGLGWGEAPYAHLVELVRAGEVDESLVDRAVARVLRAKGLLGLLEGEPYVDVAAVEERTNTPESRALAQEAAEKALVLLKNEGATLPLDPEAISTLAVIGPNAAEVHFGAYSPEPRYGVSVLEGIREYAEGRFDVVYAEGCKITEEPGSWWRDANPSPNDLEEDARLVAEAVKVAQGADVTLLVLGGNESTCREAWSEEHLGDRDRLHLPGCQGSLVWSLTSLGKPLVALLLNGRPLTLEGVEEHLDALLEGWYLGQEGGRAFARVLFGEVNPGGKLTVTFPRSVGQLPAYYNHKPSRHRSYALTENGPLFPFGHGLSYTEFEYGPLTLAPEVISPDGEAVASVEVSNAGEVAGDEVVQLYVRDEVSSVTRPVMELRGFRRMALEPGESRTVSFRLGPEALRCYDREMRRVVEPGDFTIMVGASSADIRGRATLRVR